MYRILCPNNRLSLQLLSFRLLQSVTSMILLSSATAHQFQISYFIEIRLLLLAPSSNSAPTIFFLQRQIRKLPAKKQLWLYFVWIREKDYREKEDLYVIGELLRYTENAVSGPIGKWSNIGPLNRKRQLLLELLSGIEKTQGLEPSPTIHHMSEGLLARFYTRYIFTLNLGRFFSWLTFCLEWPSSASLLAFLTLLC